eukprot:TRINITY_DN10758_c0_g1_i2.p1 TRINITY_DN10758_c0_g1~~TRINITY_DN10758_c0_g1_i2.p1  ORF type:complete len:418 (+),score=100.64 TRINITY_DN10758_c0_g1_i2:293-1546(+)
MAEPMVAGGQLYQNVTDEEAQTAVRERPPYLHGKISRQETEQLMRDNGYGEGLFLLRESTRTPGDFALSVIANGKLQHFKVSRRTGQYRIDDGPGFGNLNELIQYYRSPDDRMPVPLDQFCSRAVSAQETKAYEKIWREEGPGGPAAVTAGMQNMSIGGRPAAAPPQPAAAVPTTQPREPAPAPIDYGQPVVAIQSEGPYAASPLIKPDGTVVNPNPAPATQAASTATAPNGTNLEEREGFRNIPRVKEWFDRDDAIAQVDLKVKEETTRKPTDINADSERADQHAQQFSEAALAEEKMYLVWLNDHLSKEGQPEVPDLADSIKTAVPVLWALKSVSEQKAPFFHKNPRTVPQQVDNWSILFKWMKKLDIPVEEQGEGEDYSPALDATALHQADRREILKLFSRLLMFEANKNPFPF